MVSVSNSSFKCLVTGADGFIGSHLVEALVRGGYNVRAFCQYNSQGSWGWLDTIDKEVKENIDVRLGDIRDSGCVTDATIGCLSIYHLAALIGIPYSYVAPRSYVETNIVGTLNVLEAAKQLEVENVVHTSTSETYGTAQYVPINERHPIVAQSPYAASKAGADQLALSYWRSFGLPVSVLRPFNTYGPRQSARAVIPTIISQALRSDSRITLGSLSPTRDFNYVEDTCNAFISVANSSETIGKVVNAASMFEISIEEVAKVICDLLGRDFNVDTEQKRVRPVASEVNRLYGDNTLLKELTEWKPKYNGLDGFRKGLKKTVEWFSDPNNLQRYRDGKYEI
jgi:NAD dependent epimerase/dehydratase